MDSLVLSSYFPAMTSRLLFNGGDVSPFALSPAPPSSAFFVNVFEFDTGNWLGTVPAPSPNAIPLSLLRLSQSSSQNFRPVLFFSPQFRASICVLPLLCRDNDPQVSNKRRPLVDVTLPGDLIVFCRFFFVRRSFFRRNSRAGICRQSMELDGV